jgi:hypothetical protein
MYAYSESFDEHNTTNNFLTRFHDFSTIKKLFDNDSKIEKFQNEEEQKDLIETWRSELYDP